MKDLIKGINGQDVLKFMSENKDIAHSVIDSYNTIQKNASDLKKLEMESKERITIITHKYQLVRDILAEAYGERFKALNAHYKVLDMALESDDREMIISSLKSISSIVQTNPIADFDKLKSILNNDNETLQLDF